MSMAQLGHAQSVDDELRQKLSLTMAKARVTQIIDGQTFVVNNTKTIQNGRLKHPTPLRTSKTDLSLSRARSKRWPRVIMSSI